MKNFKRHLSMLLAFIMLVTIIPFKSFATDDVKIYNVKVTNGEFDLRGSYIKDGNKKITFNQFRRENNQYSWNKNNNIESYYYSDGNDYKIIVPLRIDNYNGNFIEVLKNGWTVDRLYINEVNTRLDNIGSEQYLKDNSKFTIDGIDLMFELPILGPNQTGTYKFDNKAEDVRFYGGDKVFVERLENNGYGRQSIFKNHKITLTIKESGKKDISYDVEYKPNPNSLSINYAYIVGNNLVLNVTSDFGINERAIQYSARGDRDYREIDYNHGLGYSSNNRYLLGSYSENYYDPNKIYDKNDYVIKKCS